MTTLASSSELCLACVSPDVRVRTVKLLVSFAHCSPEKALDIERALIRREPWDLEAFLHHSRRIAFNLACNRPLHECPAENLVYMTDEELAEGTVVQRIQKEENERMHRYTALLKEKYDNVKQSSDTMLRCKQCGSSEISWNQKQVRGADEASTIFCSCLNPKCKKRWRLS